MILAKTEVSTIEGEWDAEVSFDGVRYRRQFILAPHPLPGLDSWRHEDIGDGYNLYAHPDLDVTPVVDGKSHAILLGFILDPQAPNDSNAKILQRIITGLPDLMELSARLRPLAGRYVLIWGDDKHKVLVHDAAGQRQVVFLVEDSGRCWCASQPGLIAVNSVVSPADGAMKSFLGSPFFTEQEHWFPADSTSHSNIKRLLPNHALWINNGRVERYWPNARLRSVAYTEAVDQCATLLQDILVAAARRFDLALPITSGIDSRLILAATRPVANEIYYYTLLYDGLSDGSADVAIPRTMLSRAGIDHHILDCRAPTTPAFREMYKNNVEFAHESWSGIVQGLMRYYPQNRVSLKGNGSPIGKCHYHKYYYPKSVTAELLLRLTHMNPGEFALSQQRRWLENAANVEKLFGYLVLDLLYWEQREGCWQAWSQIEFDLAHEQFTVFNCRALLELLLSVVPDQRRPPRYALFTGIIEALWPELLKEPINPAPWHDQFEVWAKAVVGKCYRMVTGNDKTG